MITLKYPPHAHWEVTPECNHNCIHCYNYWRKDREKLESKQTSFPEERYLSIANKLIELNPHTITITGGEPLLVFDKIKSSIKLLKKNDIGISINTNSTLITDDIIDFLLAEDIGLFISFPCHDSKTCDFITSRKGSLKKILKALDTLYERKVRFTLNVVVSKANIDYIEDTVKFLKERYDIKKIFLSRVGKPVNSSDSFNQYLLSYEDFCKFQDICVKVHNEYDIKVDTGSAFTHCSFNSEESFELFGLIKACTAGKTSYAIDVFGNVKACPRDSTIYGNLLTEDFSDIWARMDEWRNGSLLPIECKICNKKSSCNGGCRVEAYPFTGKLNSLDPYCQLDKLPVKYEKKLTYEEYNEDRVFSLLPIKCIEENGCFRLASRASYILVTEKLRDFLFSKSSFTVKEVMDHFSVNSVIACSVVSKLVSNRIVY